MPTGDIDAIGCLACAGHPGTVRLSGVLDSALDRHEMTQRYRGTPPQSADERPNRIAARRAMLAKRSRERCEVVQVHVRISIEVKGFAARSVRAGVRAARTKWPKRVVGQV